MSKITIKGQKTPTRCEICHQDDVFIPHLNSCYRCDDIDVDKLDEFEGSDGPGRVSQLHYQQQYQQQEYEAQRYQQQYQHYQPQYQPPNQYSIVTSSKPTRNYPYKTPLQKVVTSLKLTKMGELPSLPNANANANTNANQAFPSMVEKASYNNTYRPQQIYVSYPKQRGIFFQIGVFTGVIMAVMFLFSLFLTK